MPHLGQEGQKRPVWASSSEPGTRPSSSQPHTYQGRSCSGPTLIQSMRMGCKYRKRRGCEKKYQKLSQSPLLCAVNSKSKSAKKQIACAGTWVWRLFHLSSSTKPPQGAGQSGEAESLRRFPVQLQLPRFRCDYACDSPPQAFWHRDQSMILFPFVPPSQPCQHMPVCHVRPRTV